MNKSIQPLIPFAMKIVVSSVFTVCTRSQSFDISCRAIKTQNFMKILLIPVKTVTIALLLFLFTSNLFGQTRVQFISHGILYDTSIPLTLGSAPVIGNTLVAIVSYRANTTRVSQISQGDAEWKMAVKINNPGGIEVGSGTEIWYAPIVSADPDIVITLLSKCRAAAVVIEYHGILQLSPLDLTATGTGNSTSASTGTTATTNQTHELWIGGVSLSNSDYTLTEITNSFDAFTNVSSTYSVHANNTKVYALERIVDATGTAYSGGTISGSGRWSGAIATFKAVGYWTGATNNLWDVTNNWSSGVLPTAGTNVVIPAVTYLPEVNITDAVCNNLTINSGASLTVNPGQALTVSGNLQNNGTLNLNSTSASAIFSLIMGVYSGSGIANVQLFLTGGGTKPYWKWHYVAVPVDGLSKTYFTNINALNLRAYDDSRVTTSDFNGWSWHDGYAGTPGIPGGGGFDNLSYGKGYLFWNDFDATVNFTGMPSLGTTLGTASLQYSGSTPGLVIYGYNFLGNSLTCSLNWENVTFGGSVEHIVYYTTGNLWASYSQTAHEGTNGGTQYIPPLQGFFVKANAIGANVDLSGAKVHSAQARYKKSESSLTETKEDIIYPKVKLELNGPETSDETIVWFNDEATTGYDENYDGYKLFSSEATFGQLYSILGGRNYVINGISLPSDSTIVPLGVKIAQAGNYSLLRKVLEKLDNYDVYLIDKANGNYIVDLKKSDKYTFSSDAGTFIDRFVLKFASLTTSAEDPKDINKNFNIYGTESFINILPPDDFAGVSDGIVRIYNLTGRIVKQVNSIGLYGGSLLQIPFTGHQGVYIVEIKSGLSSYKGKVLVK
jgi:hypothetical protein